MARAGDRSFQAIYFDLFNTLLHFDFSLLPEVQFEGMNLRTTTVEIYRRLQAQFDFSFSYEHFLKEFLESKKVINERIARDYREYTCLARCRIVCEGLEIEAEGAAELMVEAHMEEMFRMMYLPEENREVLDQLSDFPLILVSNFDHAPTARRALRKFSLEERFEEIFISDEVGWRKPGEKIFQTVLEDSRYLPAECLYVGDDPDADVRGAGRQGFQVAWLAQKASSPPSIAPRWVIQELSEVLEIVRGE